MDRKSSHSTNGREAGAIATATERSAEATIGKSRRHFSEVWKCALFVLLKKGCLDGVARLM